MKVLLPPGLGDLHWVLLKLEDFMRQRGVEIADAWIWDLDPAFRRSLGLIERIPFLRAQGYYPMHQMDWHIYAGLCINATIDYVETWDGFDYVLALNGKMDHGMAIEPMMGGAAVNWAYEITATDGEREARDRLVRPLEPYVLLYLSEIAQFQSWVRHLTPDLGRELIHRLHARFPGHHVVMIGMPWDAPFSERIGPSPALNLNGKTSFDEYMALIRNASAILGFANGNTILGSHFGIPTLMVWSTKTYPHAGFRHNWVRPGAWYATVEIENLNVSQTLQTWVGILGDLVDGKREAGSGQALLDR